MNTRKSRAEIELGCLSGLNGLIMASQLQSAKIITSTDLSSEWIDKSIRILGRIKKLNMAKNQGIAVLEDNKTLLNLNFSLLSSNKPLRVNALYHFIGFYRREGNKDTTALYLRIARELPATFSVQRYLKCVKLIRIDQ